MKQRDIKEVHKLINRFAEQGEMLSRSLRQLYEGMRDYFVAVKDGQIVGCSSLHLTWANLGEIRSIAVKKEYQNQNIGGALVRACLKEAKNLELKKIFLLTNKPDYFKRFDFKIISKVNLPKRIWSECMNCPRFPDYCDEVAMIKIL